MGYLDQVGGKVNATVRKTPVGKALGVVEDASRTPDLADLPNINAPRHISTNQYAAPTNLGIGQVNGQMIDVGAANQSREYQNTLAQQLVGQVNGTAPSLAAEQARATMNQGIAQQMAMANSARGGNAAAAGRQAMMAGSDMAAQATQQASMARLAEQMQAGQLLGQVSGQMRGQDLQVATDQAKLQQEAAVQSQLLNVKKAELTAQYKSMGLDARKANQMADIEVQKLIQQRAMGQNGQVLQIDQNKKQFVGGMVGAGGQGAMAAASMASDRNVKTDVQPGEAKLREFLSAVTVNDYEYTDKKYGEGRFVSPMAQDLLKTDLGRSMVKANEDGTLIVDYGKGLGAMLAAQADLHKRLDALESKKGKK